MRSADLTMYIVSRAEANCTLIQMCGALPCFDEPTAVGSGRALHNLHACPHLHSVSLIGYLITMRCASVFPALPRRGKQHYLFMRRMFANSHTLSVDWQYFKGNPHSIHLCRVYSMPWWMPNSVKMYRTFCLTSLPHVSFVFTFRCKPGFIWIYHPWPYDSEPVMMQIIKINFYRHTVCVFYNAILVQCMHTAIIWTWNKQPTLVTTSAR